MIVAHIFGLPVEETLPQIVPAGIVAFLIVVRRMRERTRRWATRLGRIRPAMDSSATAAPRPRQN